MPPLFVVLDACVLFPASLRDTLLRAADHGLYTIQLTNEILEETRRNLVKKGQPANKAQRIITEISEAFSDVFVAEESYTPLIPTMSNHEKDRHVLAAAVACKAQIIVTQNLKDFPASALDPFHIKVQSADQFLVFLYSHKSKEMVDLIVKQSLDLHNPPMTVSEVLNTLKQHTPTFVSLIYRAESIQKHL